MYRSFAKARSRYAPHLKESIVHYFNQDILLGVCMSFYLKTSLLTDSIVCLLCST